MLIERKDTIWHVILIFDRYQILTSNVDNLQVNRIIKQLSLGFKSYHAELYIPKSIFLSYEDRNNEEIFIVDCLFYKIFFSIQEV